MSRGGSPAYRRRRKRLTFPDRLRRLAAVGLEHVDGPGLYITPIAHDEWCPALETHSLRGCTCEPWFRQPVRIESAEALSDYYMRRGAA
jgi:hypothetical protein